MPAKRSSAAEPLRTLAIELRTSLRRWSRSPTAATVVTATLVLGIGLCTLVFMVADSILFRAPDFAEPDRLVSIETNTGGDGWYGSSEPEFIDLGALDVFTAVGAWRSGMVLLASDPEPQRIQVAHVTEEMLPMLGIQPAMGRFPDASESLEGADPVIVLGHRLWQRAFGSSPDIMGEKIYLDDQATEVIGVMPADFHFPVAQFEAWVPLPIDRDDLWGRNNHYLNVIARLSGDTTVSQAATAVGLLADQSARAFPEFYEEHGFATRTQLLRTAQTAGVRLPMTALLASVGLLLLLTCANLANVQLSRGAARQRELAMRRALGASRGRLVAELMIDSAVVSVLGAVGALTVVAWVARILPPMLPDALLRFGMPSLDLRVVGFCLLVTTLTTVVFGLWPALRSLARQDALLGRVASLGRTSGSSRWLRSSLVVSQMTLAAVLLVGCGMTVRSLLNILDVDPGFEARGVLVLDVVPSETVLPSPEQIVTYYRQAEQALATTPGVIAAGAMQRLPLTGSGSIWSIEFEGQPVSNIASAPFAQVQQATPGMFAALDIRAVRGRLLGAGDTVDSEPVAVVNESFARSFFQGEEPVGKRFRVFSQDAPFLRVVGVVEDVRDGRLDQAGKNQWYVPHAQAYQSAYYSPREMRLVIKTDRDSPVDIAPSILSRLVEINPRVAIVRPSNLVDTVAASLSLPRQMAVWFLVFSATAFVLAGLGLYGVLSFMITVRRSEIGIRMALGETSNQVLLRVVGEGLGLCAIGLALGLTAGLGLARLAGSLFFEVQHADVAVLGTTAIALLTLGVLSPLAPALRASRTDPCVALRPE